MKPIDFADFLQQIVGMFEPGPQQGPRFPSSPSAICRWCVRDEKQAAPDPHQPAGQRGEVHRQGRLICLRLTYRGDGHLRGGRHRPWHLPGRDRAHLRSLLRGTSAQGAGGAGLGLTISRMFADVMGGGSPSRASRARAAPSGCACSCPRCAARSCNELPRNRVGYRGERRRILVVDNERVDREFLITCWSPGFFAGPGRQRAGMPRHGAAALPDLVFMDLAMPGIDGWETSGASARARAVLRWPRCRWRSSRPTPTSAGCILTTTTCHRRRRFLPKPVRWPI